MSTETIPYVGLDLGFLGRVAELAPIFVAPPGGAGEFIRPTGWQGTPRTDLDVALKGWEDDWAVCAVTGEHLAVVDVDVRHDGDPEKVRRLLDGLAVQVFATVATPGGGKHFYIAGHPS